LPLSARIGSPVSFIYSITFSPYTALDEVSFAEAASIAMTADWDWKLSSEGI
jgi:hypothetical protein